MKGYRIMQIIYKHFLIVLTIVYLACYPSYGQVNATLPLNDPNSVLKIILSAANNYQLPLTGRGKAILKMEKNYKLFDDKELIVDFVFKGSSSRVNIFDSNDGAKNSRLLSEAVTDKQVIRFTPTYESARIDGFQEHKKIGLDYHSDVFLDFRGTTLVKWLKGLMKYPPDYASVEIDTEGILHYIAGGHLVHEGEGFDEELKLSFDTNKGLLPVSYYLENKYVDPNKNWGAEAKLEWSKFDSVWYLTQAEYFVQPGKRKHVVFTVKDFTPNVDVSDNKFTLDDMGIPDGTTIADSIAGIAYRYGTSPDFIENLEEPLNEADFVKKQSSLTNQDINANTYHAPLDQNLRNINDVNSQKLTTVGQTGSLSLWRYVIVIVCVVAFIGVIAFLKYRTIS